ncbi:bcl-2-like protein 10 [Alligator mississippiensis]|uniref:bcl-2-like protein 10 n=1 Tax=Alligator mississippiensis TaxID=8496 RepID=UPI0003D0D226|nr:bcl-2-like protein 10 [Alligator mississippiensis]
MPGPLKEETALLLADYFQHRLGGTALPPSPAAEALRRAAGELESREQPFFRSCRPLARAEPREAAALLARVAAQLEADGGLNWGRVLALVVFAGSLAAALAERGEDPARLADVLAAYLAEEQREWLEAHGGWDGFYHFFNRHGSQPADQSNTISTIMAAAGFGLAGLAFLLAVR